MMSCTYVRNHFGPIVFQSSLSQPTLMRLFSYRSELICKLEVSAKGSELCSRAWVFVPCCILRRAATVEPCERVHEINTCTADVKHTHTHMDRELPKQNLILVFLFCFDVAPTSTFDFIKIHESKLKAPRAHMVFFNTMTCIYFRNNLGPSAFQSFLS